MNSQETAADAAGEDEVFLKEANTIGFIDSDSSSNSQRTGSLNNNKNARESNGHAVTDAEFSATVNEQDELDELAVEWARRESILLTGADGSIRGSQIINPEDEVCGWGPFHPDFCQRFRSPRWVLVWLSLAGMCQGMIVNGFVLNSISTLERRFDLKSSETGVIASGYDFASLVCLIPVSYFGGVGRKPHWVGFGVLIMALGSCIFMLPHFLTDVYLPSGGDGERDICLTLPADSGKPEMQCGVGLLNNYKYMFIVGQLMHGVGATPLYTLGVSYLDDNLLPSTTSLYVGIFYSLSIVGPAVGFLLGGVFLDIYTDSGTVDVEELGLTSTSPKWVGAWWIGFIFASCIGAIVSFTLCGFPKSLPGRKEVLKLKVSEAHGDTGGQAGAFSGSLKEFPGMLKKLLTNPTFVMVSLAGTMESLILSGFATFAPKFVESQFAVTASFASIIVGAIAVPAGGGGTFFGGWIIKHKKLKLRGIILLCLGFAATSFFLCFGYLVQCENYAFAGVNHYYPNETQYELTAKCNMDCSCSREVYNPVCDADNIQYFSPCHAGCVGEGVHIPEKGKHYGSCSCIAANLTLEGTAFQVREGKCEGDCKLLPVFLIFFFGVTALTFLASMPALSATLRSVPENQKSFALGIQWLIVRAFGTIPAAPIIGGIIDFSCVLWQEDCGSIGSCYAYDNSKMGTYLMAAGLTVKFFSVFFLLGAYLVYKPPAAVASDEADNPPEVDYLYTQTDVNVPQETNLQSEITEL